MMSLLGKIPELLVSWANDTDFLLAQQGMSTLSIAELRAEQKKKREKRREGGLGGMGWKTTMNRRRCEVGDKGRGRKWKR